MKTGIYSEQVRRKKYKCKYIQFLVKIIQIIIAYYRRQKNNRQTKTNDFVCLYKPVSFRKRNHPGISAFFASFSDFSIFYTNDLIGQFFDSVQVMAGDPVAYPMRKAADTDTLVAAVNDILQELRDSGELAEISKEFFGLDLTQPD